MTLLLSTNCCKFGKNLSVTAASNVLEAWRILEDKKSCIDLVLTEVVMPVQSGTGLLSKIMSHKTLKNIPVISIYLNPR